MPVSGQYACSRGISLQSAAATDGMLTLSSTFSTPLVEGAINRRGRGPSSSLLSQTGKLERWTEGRGRPSRGRLFISHSPDLKEFQDFNQTVVSPHTVRQIHAAVDRLLSHRNFLQRRGRRPLSALLTETGVIWSRVHTLFLLVNKPEKTLQLDTDRHRFSQKCCYYE